MSSDKPPYQRPERAEFWDKRYREQTTPWDAGGVPQALRAWVARQPAPLETLIPGCGSAWELAWLAEQGWPVTALDFSAPAVAHARRLHPAHAARIVHGDFFAWQPPVTPDLIYERAFLCALPRQLWRDWAARCAALLHPGNRLAGFFYFDEEGGGPPFAIRPATLDALLSPHFERVEDDAVAASIPVFQGKERWQVWQRR